MTWTFEESREACRLASAGQRSAEDALREAARVAALADEQYRLALAREIVLQHDAGVAWSTAPDLARGNAEVASLRRERDIREGALEAIKQAAWRAAADRKDAQRFADYSLRRDLMEYAGGGEQPAWSATG